MAKKSKILRNFKEVKKNVVPVAVNSAISGVSYLGAKAATNLLTPKITNPTMKKIVGPVKIILGMAIEAFIEQSNIAAIGRGLAVSGFDTSADDFIPDTVKTKIGLSGVGYVNADPDNTFDWEAAAHEAGSMSGAQGNDDNANKENTGSSNESPTNDLASKAMTS